jgi:hypothetical protein
MRQARSLALGAFVVLAALAAPGAGLPDVPPQLGRIAEADAPPAGFGVGGIAVYGGGAEPSAVVVEPDGSLVLTLVDRTTPSSGRRGSRRPACRSRSGLRTCLALGSAGPLACRRSRSPRTAVS